MAGGFQGERKRRKGTESGAGDIRKGAGGKEMAEEKPKTEEKLTIDARLLSEAVIEFNISRKNVGLYPPGHIRITNAIDKAFGHITKLFEYRSSITLGITKNSLIIDNKALDSRNPVYRECARSFHDLGIAGITFQTGLQKGELVRLHEIMTRKDPPTGKAIVEAAVDADIKYLKLSPIDHTSFKFISDKSRMGDGKGGAGGGRDTTEDYVYGLLEGKLAGGGVDDSRVLLGLSAKDIAAAIEKSEEKSEESYDHVISAYMSKTDKDRLSPLAMKKLVSVMDNLSEDARQQFLSRASSHLASDIQSVEHTLRNMPASEIEKITEFFTNKASGLPDSLKNVIDKLSTLSSDKGKFAFDMQTPKGTLLHDIDMGETLKDLFSEDKFESYVSTGYKKQLERMLAAPVEAVQGQIKDLDKECHPDVVDRVTSEIMLEVINQPSMERDDYLNIITTLTHQATDFVMTGRFDEARQFRARGARLRGLLLQVGGFHRCGPLGLQALGQDQPRGHGKAHKGPGRQHGPSAYHGACGGACGIRQEIPAPDTRGRRRRHHARDHCQPQRQALVRPAEHALPDAADGQAGAHGACGPLLKAQ
jgi:hypothetical protein